METGCPIPGVARGQWKRKTISLSRTNSHLDLVLQFQPLYPSKSSPLQHLVDVGAFITRPIYQFTSIY